MNEPTPANVLAPFEGSNGGPSVVPGTVRIFDTTLRDGEQGQAAILEAARASGQTPEKVEKLP